MSDAVQRKDLCLRCLGLRGYKCSSTGPITDVIKDFDFNKISLIYPPLEENHDFDHVDQ